MPPEEVVPDDAAETPVSPDSEEESSASEEGADAEDAAQAESAEEEAPEKDEADEGEESLTVKGRSEAFKNLRAKYKDGDELAKAYWEQANSNSKLHERLDSIEKYIKGQQEKEPPVDLDKVIAEDPDVQALNEEFKETAALRDAANADYAQLIKDYGQNEKDIARWEGKLEVADPDRQDSIQHKLDSLRADNSKLVREIRSTQEKIARAKLELTRLDRNIKKAESEAKQNVTRQREEKKAELEGNQEIRSEFVAVMAEEAKKRGMDPESEEFGALFLAVRDRLDAHLASLGKDDEGIDIPEAARFWTEKYAKTWKLDKSFQKRSVAKLATLPAPTKTEPVSPKQGSAPAGPKAQWTRKSVDERARRLLGG